jgi:hypothetical protein
MGCGRSENLVGIYRGVGDEIWDFFAIFFEFFGVQTVK